MQVLFTGFFRKDLIQVTHNGRRVFSDTVTTVDEDFEYIFPLRDFTFEAKKINRLYVAVNGLEMKVPLKKRYGLLYIGYAPDRIMSKNVTLYYFNYTNDYAGHM